MGDGLRQFWRPLDQQVPLDPLDLYDRPEVSWRLQKVALERAPDVPPSSFPAPRTCAVSQHHVRAELDGVELLEPSLLAEIAFLSPGLALRWRRPTYLAQLFGGKHRSLGVRPGFPIVYGR
jgi:hypothetical protein